MRLRIPDEFFRVRLRVPRTVKDEGLDDMTKDLSIGITHPFVLAVLAMMFSVGLAYGALGSGIKVNAKDIQGLAKTIEAVDGLVTRQAVADQIQKTQGEDIANILRILEDGKPSK